MSQFLTDIFLPEKVGTYYLFSKYVVGVEITKTTIIATKVCLQGKKTIIESIIEEKYEAETTQELENVEVVDPVTKALKLLFEKIGHYDEVYTTVPSSLAVFKELRLPFTSREKIGMVIEFEIEPLLPFALSDAVIDFIITREIPQEKAAEILVTAVQKQHIMNIMEVFEKAGVMLDGIVVDMIALYGLYKRIPVYRDLPGGVALIEISYYSTRIMLISNGQLKTIRTLSKGILSLTKKVATALNKAPNEVLDTMLRFGTEETQSAEYKQEMDKAITSLVDEINFTLTSFAAQILDRNIVTKILLLGDDAATRDFTKVFNEKIKIPCEPFNSGLLSEDTALETKNGVTVTSSNVISVSTALFVSSSLEGYNLKSQKLTTPSYTGLLKHLVVIIVLTLGISTTLLTHYVIQTARLKKEIRLSSQEALQSLKDVFPSLEEETVLDDAIESAQIDLTQQQETWFAFSNNSRTSFLQCLLELTSKVDRKSIGLDVEQLSIAEGVITLKASVKDHEALKTFERELSQSKLLSNFEPQESLAFTMRIVLPHSSKENAG